MTPVSGPYYLQIPDMKWLIQLQKVSFPLLAKITENRALVLPNGDRLDPLVKENWSMPYGSGEYEQTDSVIGRALDNIWRPNGFEPIEGVVQYEEKFDYTFPSDVDDFEYEPGTYGPTPVTTSIPRANPRAVPRARAPTRTFTRREPEREPSPTPFETHHNQNWDREDPPIGGHFGTHFEVGDGLGTHTSTGSQGWGQGSDQDWQQGPGYVSHFEVGDGSRPQHRERDFGRDFNTHMHTQQHTTPYDDFSFMHEANRNYYHRDESSPLVAPDTS